MITCQFCNKDFSTKTNLTVHQKTAKYCLSLQGKQDIKNFECEYCLKNFTSNQTLNDHKLSSCKEKLKKDYVKEYNNELELTKEKNSNLEMLIHEKDKKIIELSEKLEKFENALIAASVALCANEKSDDDDNNDIPIPISHRLNQLIDPNQDITSAEQTVYDAVIKQLIVKEQRIKQLEQACLAKRKRVEIPQRNVIYLITTDDHLKRRTYIIGKAKNLTNRLSVYNKTCDHTIAHYRECKNEDDMAIAETMILGKLRDFREQANRDRFILPDDKDVSFFTNVIDQCVDFLK